ncbi:PilZ domain-containing protein [Sphingomonas sanguinis]|uniref:PilZ domain-containing protein n=1 Tax=Sphingomonas sp. LC-1 TaxID=3110957 RepID=UPI0021BB7A13|nr:PilZ domain-containing protein [Sphingomonas sp. LC-1]MCT8000894.1 PilZ domain-containing protein [Sphingomonas sp. LC-1]
MEQIEQQESASAERRSGQRHSAVLLLGKVCGDVPGVCLVHNISGSGLMARFVNVPAVGDSICIEVRGLPPVPGTVRWVRGQKAGVQFDTPQPYQNIFSAENEDGTIPRPPRFPVTLAAEVRLSDRKFASELIDVSAGGAKLVASGTVQPGLAGHIIIRPMGTALFGTICWVKDGRFGFRFVSPLPLDTLASIVATR